MMGNTIRPWQILVMGIAGLITKQQQQVIEYLMMENKVLREKIGKKRILLSDNQRRRLAVKGKALGRKTLSEIETIFSPETILKWHRLLVAKKWDYSKRRGTIGRPQVDKSTIMLVLRIAKDNPSWGYGRIRGSLKNLKITISETKIAEILKEHGIEPAPERKKKSTWTTFIKSQMECLGAMDFTTLEVWTLEGLPTYYLLFVMKLGTREVEFTGMTTNPNSAWIKQTCRNLTDQFDGFLTTDVRYLIMDRDPVFTEEFRRMIEDDGIEIVRLPPKSPNLNAFLERFNRTVKQECLKKIVPIGERSVIYAVRTFLTHYHHERYHQGLENNLISAGEEVKRTRGGICRKERLGGLLNYYYRRAA